MKILLIGCGKMGQAMKNGWNHPHIDVITVDPANGNFGSIDEVTSVAFTHVIIAVKPQIIDALMPKLRRFSNSIFITIVAGKNISFYRKSLPNAKLLRTMPNLPATIKQGVIVYFNSGLNNVEMDQALQLIAALGKHVEIKDEKLFDIVTAISGSGPAYTYSFATAMLDSAVKNGLPPELAKILVTETIIGSMNLAKVSEKSFAELKTEVTSKGGTTEAGLKVLENSDFNNIMDKTIIAAKTRSEELSN